MAAVDIVNVKVLDNPAAFTNPLQFEITYEVREVLEDDIEWQVIYVGSAESEAHDQVLESVLLPADTTGTFVFVLQVDPPQAELIPKPDIVGVTIVLLTCSYKDTEFIRAGYYVNNAYTDAEMHENPPPTPVVEKLQRTILADAPRVTRFPHKFDYVNTLGDEEPMEVEKGKQAWEEPMLSRDGQEGKAGHSAFAMMGGDKPPGFNPFAAKTR